MAAEIVGRRGNPAHSPTSSSTPLPPPPPPSNGRKPELLNKLEGGSDEINGVFLIPDENGVISVSSDRSVRIWLLRDSGQYWPSICHYMTSAVTAVQFYPGENGNGKKLFVGVESGSISEFEIAADYNRMDLLRDYHAHQSRVNHIIYSTDNNYCLSVAKDKYFQYHDTTNGRRLGGYQCGASCTALEYDERDKYVFIGDMSGAVTVVKIVENGVQFVNTLKGHSGSIQSIKWNGQRGWLFSGSYDSSVFIWDIGGRKGTVYELQGHRNKVTSLAYSPSSDRLLSTGEDMNLVVWKLNCKRLETSEWSESDNCQLCNRPFYWNFRAMYDQKQIGLRQHHCRKCGKAICDSCSMKRSQLPSRGYEFMVRVCEECYIGITEEDKKSYAEFYELKHNVTCLDYDDKRKILATAGKDRIIKIWSLKDVIV